VLLLLNKHLLIIVIGQSTAVLAADVTVLFVQVQNPIYELGEYLMHVSTPDELHRNPLLQPGMNSKVDYSVLR